MTQRRARTLHPRNEKRGAARGELITEPLVAHCVGKFCEAIGHLGLFGQHLTEKRHRGRLGAWMVWIATVPLWRYLLQRPLCSRQLGSGAVDACGRSSLPLSRDVSIELRRFVVPLAQKCIKTGWCVLSSLSLRPNWSLENAWTPCLLTNQWNGRRGMHKKPVQSSSSPSRPPAPHTGDDPGAMNSASLNTSATGPFTAMLKSPPRPTRPVGLLACEWSDVDGGLVGDSGRTDRSLSAASKPRITQRTARNTPSI